MPTKVEQQAEALAERNAEPAAVDRLDPKLWKTLLIVLLGPFMAQMDSTVVNVSVSTIGQELHSSIEATQWVMSGYLLTLALMLPLNGWLVDRLGAKRLYLICFSTFTLSSLLCGAAGTIDQLIWARVVQGMAGGLMAPLTQLMLARSAGKQLARVMGYAAIPILIAPTVGPILAGAILRYGGWPWLFYINLPVGVTAVLLAWLLLPGDEARAERRPFDFVGFLMISPGLAMTLYGFEQAAHHHANWAVIGLGVALLAGFLWHARRNPTVALVDIGLFKNQTFAMAAITQFWANGIMYAGQFLVPLFLTIGVGLTGGEAGWLLAPTGLGMMCVYPFMGKITDRFGCRWVTSSGIMLNVVGTLPFLWMSLGHYSQALTVICLFLRGVGQGCTGVPTIAAAYASVPKERLSFATTALNITQRLGGPVATMGLAVVVSMTVSDVGAVDATAAAHPQGFTIPFVVLSGIQVLVLASATRLPKRVFKA